MPITDVSFANKPTRNLCHLEIAEHFWVRLTGNVTSTEGESRAGEGKEENQPQKGGEGFKGNHFDCLSIMSSSNMLDVDIANNS